MSDEAATASPDGLLAFARTLWKLMPRRIAAAVGLSALLGATEGAGVLVLIPLLSVAGIPVAQGSVGRMSAAVSNAITGVGIHLTLGGVLLAYVAVVAVQAVAQRAQLIVTYDVEKRAALAMRTRLYAAIAEARWPFLARTRASDLVHALTVETDRVGTAAAQLLLFFAQMLAGAAYLAVALRISPAVTVVALACGGVLLAFQRGPRRAARMAGQGLSRAHGELFAAATEHLQGMKVVKSYGAEQRNVRIFGALAEGARQMHGRTIRAYADARAGFTLGSVVLLGGVLYLAVEVLGVPAAVAVLLIFVFSRLVPRLLAMQQVYQQIVHELPAFAAVRALTARCEAEREMTVAEGGPLPLERGIRFEHVSFAYDEDRPVISGLDVTVQARRTTAFVGPSGAGKTTVADLVMGLVAPTAGRVVLDGAALDEGAVRRWREGIGYVAQDTVLFHDTVRANLLWARPDATEDELRDVLRAASAEEFVDALAEGLDTVIGDRGVRLSGGERQRLALARALLRRPSLLILDEATSALDTDNERRILRAIAELHGRTTILVITHRLSTVRDADAIHVLEAGRLVESGDWTTLTADENGRFRRMWASQEEEGPFPSE
ncbi:MAG TPA: ABC transporter ATP-binding protein [Longimicrobiaceae bacterium]|nr:ABC transporter ATP-binding protein [Longimicrobiaceae bacterium]